MLKDLYYDFREEFKEDKIFWIKFFSFTVIAMFLILLFLYLFVPIKEEVTIKAFSWRYEVVIDELRTIEEHGWYVPSGGVIKDKEWKWHYSKKREIAKDSEGNSIYTEIPVYDWYYTYDIDKYVFNRNVISTAMDKEPFEPEYVLSDKEKVSKTKIIYYIHVYNKDGSEQTFTTSKDIFDSAEFGATISIKHFRFNDKILKMKVT